MKGSKAILALAALLVIIGASTLWAQNSYALMASKTISPSNPTVRFDKVLYSFTVDDCYSVCFAKLDGSHVKLAIKPLKVKPLQIVTIQWGPFEPQSLDIDSSAGGDTFLIDTETGYAEK
ncbi:MAG: hypothetical protein PHD74_08250 [Candidatus Krumholzibacteria bacterium]|nr:hypothetical protein [Candidatus Krumholzibacteria bacterium]